MKLEGTIPPILFSIRDLAEISVGRNDLTGTIPDVIGSQMGGLIGIGVEDNFLTGTIPVTLGNLYAMEALALHTNLLTGTIPE